MSHGPTAGAEVLGEARCQVGECPLWSVAESALYWVDIEGRALHRLDAEGRAACWAVPERLGAVALHGQGGLLAAMETGIFRLQPGEGGAIEVTRLHGVDFPWPSMRFNDGRTDRQGRFWVTSLVRDPSVPAPGGALHRLDAAGLGATAIDGLRTGNGLAFSPDGRTMYLSDSHPTVQQVWCFDLHDDGVPRNRRLFVDMRSLPGRPDGAAVDADGCYWICGNDAGLVHRFRPDGRLDRSLAVPAAKPSMCAFGGPRLDRLYVTSITPPAPVPGYDPALAGAVFMLDPGCQGLPERPFGPATCP